MTIRNESCKNIASMQSSSLVTLLIGDFVFVADERVSVYLIVVSTYGCTVPSHIVSASGNFCISTSNSIIISIHFRVRAFDH